MSEKVQVEQKKVRRKSAHPGNDGRDGGSARMDDVRVDHDRVVRWKHSGAHYVNRVPRRFVRLVDTSSGVIIFYESWFGSGYAPKETRYIHRWHIKSVLRRAGWR